MTPCTAEERNKKELEHIRKQQIEARATLEELDFKHKATYLLYFILLLIIHFKFCCYHSFIMSSYFISLPLLICYVCILYVNLWCNFWV